jgi:hypothetical protein
MVSTHFDVVDDGWVLVKLMRNEDDDIVAG